MPLPSGHIFNLALHVLVQLPPGLALILVSPALSQPTSETLLQPAGVAGTQTDFGRPVLEQPWHVQLAEQVPSPAHYLPHQDDGAGVARPRGHLLRRRPEVLLVPAAFDILWNITLPLVVQPVALHRPY